ncbi:MAG TPA: hypothetical protein PLB91_12685 [Spirochaetales bacterium]|nr:hypothetical protein [Spirochaetales bacterium]HRY56162.1 hypothetical protein [Spirochaetia bacterium]HRZ65633.1 hypothetical protein [Spirochaetia bacterium]
MERLSCALADTGTIGHWLLTPIEEAALRFEPVTMSGDVNRWLKEGFSINENPCRRQFVAARRAERHDAPRLEAGSGAAAPVAALEGGMLAPLSAYFPFGNLNVERSGFWRKPTSLRSWAFAELWLEAPEDAAAFELRSCGGARLWINGEAAASFQPFTRNVEGRTSFRASLRAGRNELVLLLDDLAERDTQYYFRLDYRGRSRATAALPLGPARAGRVAAAEAALAEASFPRDAITAGELELELANPFGEEAELLVEAGGGEVFALEAALSRRLALPAGARRVAIARAEDLPAGFIRFRITFTIDGVRVSRDLGIDAWPSSRAPAVPETVEARKAAALAYLAGRPGASVHRAAAIVASGAAPAALAEAEGLFLAQLGAVEERHDCADFGLVMVLRFLAERGRAAAPGEPGLGGAAARGAALGQAPFAASTWERAQRAVLGFRYWIDEPGDDVMWFFSENHALLFHACELVAGQLYPDEIFPNSGLTGREHRAKAELLLASWFERFMAEGLTEWDSSAYIPVDLLGLASLLVLAGSAPLRESAKEALDRLFRVMALKGFRGTMALSMGRCYEKELKGNYTNGTSAIAWVAWGSGFLNQSAMALAAFCLSGYEPPADLGEYLELGPGRALEVRGTQGFEGHVDLCCFRTAHFALSTACDFSPGRKGYQEQIVHCVMGPEAQLWVNHPGETHSHGSGRPSFWAGNGVLPRAGQYRGLSLLVWDLGADHPVGYTHAYAPLEAFDEALERGPWLFLRKGGAYAALWASNGYALCDRGPNRRRELVCPGRQAGWILRASDEREFPGFGAFAEALAGSKPGFDRAARSLRLADPVYGPAAISLDEGMSIGGAAVRAKGFPAWGEAALLR